MYLCSNGIYENMKRIVAAFDFDGTLTTRDSFPDFIRYATGTPRFVAGFLLYSPLLVLMKLGLYSGSKAKEQVFSHFFKGWDYKRFQALGQGYATAVENMRNESVVNQLREHIANGDTVYIVSASIRDWVEPWSLQQGVNAVIATEAEVDASGRLTGRFKTPNCSGQEKVKRLLEVEPQRDTYSLQAYGNSSGDKPLLAFADEGTLVQAHNKSPKYCFIVI